MSLSDHPSPPDCLYNKPTSLSACPSLSDHLTATTTHLTICLSSTMIQHTQESSQSLSVVNGEQSHKAKKFCRAFTSYDLLLLALDVSSIYPSDSRHVAPPKSGEVDLLYIDLDCDLATCYQGYGMLGELDQHLISLQCI